MFHFRRGSTMAVLRPAGKIPIWRELLNLIWETGCGFKRFQHQPGQISSHKKVLRCWDSPWITINSIYHSCWVFMRSRVQTVSLLRVNVPSSSGFLHALVKFTEVQTLDSLFHWLLPLITTWRTRTQNTIIAVEYFKHDVWQCVLSQKWKLCLCRNMFSWLCILSQNNFLFALKWP